MTSSPRAALPTVLFLCVHNAGRSQIALDLLVSLHVHVG
jgi:protein-tyrosine-phosphatase